MWPWPFPQGETASCIRGLWGRRHQARAKGCHHKRQLINTEPEVRLYTRLS
jgi:hypothetical protein